MQKDIAVMFGAKPAAQSKVSKPTKANPKSESTDVSVNVSATLAVPLSEDLAALATWKPGEPVPYKFVASMMTKIEAEPGRNAIIDILARHVCVIACLTPEDLIPFCFLCTGELRPAHEGVKLMIGESLIIDGISNATGRTTKQIKAELDANGDLGELAMASRAKQGRIDTMYGRRETALTVRGVYKSLLEIAKITGSNTQRNKVGKISQLMTSAKEEEVKFIIRSLSGSLRIGCAENSILIAIGKGLRLRDYFIGAVKKLPEEEELMNYGKMFKNIYKKYPLLDQLLAKQLSSDNGFEVIERECDLIVGVPVMPMLAKPAKSTAEIRQRLGECEITCEYKYDGERGQIHRTEDGKVMIFSRNAKNLTVQFQDLVPLILEHVDAESFIIDSEIVAYDVEKETILPFQTLMHRSRKGTDEVSPIQVCIFAFDVIFLNGKSLVTKPLIERRQLLQKIVNPVLHKFQTASYLDASLDNITDFFNEAVANKTEGLMIKDRQSPYEPGKRSQFWAKLKKDYVKGLGTAEESSVSDTFDVCVVGATMGKGKRAGLYGCYLVAIWNEDVARFQTICEVGTGLSDENLKLFTDFFKELVVSTPPRNVDYGKTKPQFFIQPRVVWEITAADITISPTAAACYGDVKPDAGISLRFGRFLRVREDKEPEMATRAEQILDMYMAQPNVD